MFLAFLFEVSATRGSGLLFRCTNPPASAGGTDLTATSSRGAGVDGPFDIGRPQTHIG